MAINRGDLVVFQPEFLGNTDEAGGQRTTNPVVSGQLNNLFTPISDIDHARSAVQIAKCYPTLNTENTEKLISAHVFINRPPVDPKVNVLIVESSILGDNDRLPDMVEILESSLVMSAIIGTAGEGFIEGQDTLTTFNIPATTTLVGSVVAISTEYTGSESATYPRLQHYTKIMSATPGDYLNVISGNLAKGVRYTIDPPMSFVAPAPNVAVNAQSNCTKIRTTTKSDSVIFRGVTTTTAVTAADATSVAVAATEGRVIPNIISSDLASGIRPFYTELDEAIFGIENSDNFARRISTVVVSDSSSIIFFNTANLLNPEGISARADYNLLVFYTDSNGDLKSDFQIYLREPTRLAISTPTPPKLGTTAYLYYISGSDYENFSSASLPLDVDQSIVKNTVNASALLAGSLVTIIDVNGTLVDAADETLVGTIDYDTGVVTKTNDDYGTVSYWALVKFDTAPSNTTMSFSLGVNKPKLESLQIQGLTTGDVAVSASANSAGVISGAGVSGSVSEYGEVSLTFTNPVYRGSITLDVESLLGLVPPDDFYNFNPLRIPNNGLVPIFRQFDTVSIQHAAYQAVTSPAADQVKTIRTNARFVDITDANGMTLWTPENTHFSVDIEEGEVTLHSTFPGFTAPFVLTDVIAELGMAIQVGENSLTLVDGVSREYPLGSTVSSVQVLGDLQARVGVIWDMTSWSGNWDEIGTPANGNLNTTAYPIEMNNQGAINEDWAIIFTSPTAYRCIGRGVGQIATGDTANDFAPVNPKTLQPYFIIRQEAFGGGWSAGEVIRLPTYAAAKPIMLVRVVEPGHSQITTDRATLGFRGNEA